MYRASMYSFLIVPAASSSRPVLVKMLDSSKKGSLPQWGEIILLKTLYTLGEYLSTMVLADYSLE